MNQPLNLLCLLVLTYFFLPVLSDDLVEPFSDSFSDSENNRFFPDSGVEDNRFSYDLVNWIGSYIPSLFYPARPEYPSQPENPYPEQYPGLYPRLGPVPPSPCPNIFRYVQGANGETEGRIVIPFDQSGVLELHVNGSMNGYFGQNVNMKVTLLTPSSDIFYKRTQYLIYQIQYPTQMSIPRMTAIILNGRMYCSGPPEMLTVGGPPITHMHTVHRFFFTITRDAEGDLDDNAVARKSDLNGYDIWDFVKML